VGTEALIAQLVGVRSSSRRCCLVARLSALRGR